MTRLKYIKHPNGIFTSGPFLVKNQIIMLRVSSPALKYEIQLDNGDSIKIGYANSLVLVKRKAKLALKELGVFFEDEIRNNGKNEFL